LRILDHLDQILDFVSDLVDSFNIVEALLNIFCLFEFKVFTSALLIFFLEFFKQVQKGIEKESKAADCEDKICTEYKLLLAGGHFPHALGFLRAFFFFLSL